MVSCVVLNIINNIHSNFSFFRGLFKYQTSHVDWQLSKSSPGWWFGDLLVRKRLLFFFIRGLDKGVQVTFTKIKPIQISPYVSCLQPFKRCILISFFGDLVIQFINKKRVCHLWGWMVNNYKTHYSIFF